MAVAPGTTTALAGYLMHMDLSGMSRTLTLGSFAGGLVLWTLGTALVFESLAAIYNGLVTRAAAAQRITAGHDAPQAA